MKIGVISDTHLSEPSDSLCRLMEGTFKDVSIIMHAGDLTCMGVLDVFSKKEIIAVHGNMDGSDVSERLPKKDVLTVGQYRIGLIHGWGSPWGIEERISEQFKNVHAIVYGHTHKSANHVKNGILMFNPGAFCGTFLLGHNRSVGVLTVGDDIRGMIIKV